MKKFLSKKGERLRKMRSIPTVSDSHESFICGTCFPYPLRTHLLHTVPRFAGRQGRSRPAPGFPRSAPIGRLGSGRAPRTVLHSLRPEGRRTRRSKSCAGVARAAGDARVQRSCPGYTPGGSQDRVAELRLSDHRSAGGFGPSEAVRASFAPWAACPLQYSRPLTVGGG